ncbi:TniQ family protein [Calothrix sp. FACHB-1219]|uniref:TnsD family Tn7-like transposition protein n=1 Tax=unclassified Calothrix TaxID=2619626 RepID=UPI001686B752|nr:MULTISPECIES: TnsD family Tn7-like transposition protein [unclassified Calothrix]MBD2203540.1 TniQ family protein [Calothrix sp. FACHB-168]MBD2221151.1 TniQ family protein [Calothrix sp. FACHB-1219]
MLSFFPNLYPDELLYSALARYHIRSGNKTFKQTDLELFGYSSQQLCKVTLTNNLNYLVKNLSLFSQLTVSDLLQNHTLYPFYSTFLIPQQAWQLQDSMRNKLSGSILEVAKVVNHPTENSTNFLKFCPVCLEKDTQEYGEPYWHRIHQIPGILVCPTHRIILHDSSVAVDSKGIHYHAASPENCLYNQNQVKYTDSTVEKLLILAQDIWDTSNINISFKGLAWLRNQYQYYLINQKFMNLLPGGKFRFNQKFFSNSICKFYGQEFLEIINPKLIRNSEKYFSSYLLGCDLNPVIDRITHILIIKFLANSVERFFT